MNRSTLSKLIAIGFLVLATVVGIVFAYPKVTILNPRKKAEPKSTISSSVYHPTHTDDTSDDTEEPEETEPDPTVEVDLSQCVLKDTEYDSSESYINSVLFIGDRTVGVMSKRDIIALSDPEGFKSKKVWSSPSNVTAVQANIAGNYSFDDPYSGVESDFISALKGLDKKPQFVILTFGSFCAGSEDTEEVFKIAFTSLITKIKSVSPDTEVIIQSILPVGMNCVIFDESSRELINISPDQIILRNTWLLKIAYECGVKYLDTWSALVGGDNKYLSSEYYDINVSEEDTTNYLMNSAGCNKLLNYVRTHVHPDFTEDTDQ